MKFFTKYSLFSNVVSIVIIIIAMLYISEKALEGGKPSKKASSDKRVELTALDFHYNKYNKDGDLETNLAAEKLDRYINQDLKLMNLTQKSYDKETGKETWRVKSKYGYVQQFANQNITHLYDGVDAIFFTKKSEEDLKKASSGISPNKIFIKTSEIYYKSDTKDFYNSRFTKIYDPKTGNNTTGIGISGNSDAEAVILEDNVRSYYASS